ncbi:MAG: hypothetical protein CMP59_01060 [Flavobacteriales bacterium]|nr:hypothetical protein [Flavobacteriales bacterium]
MIQVGTSVFSKCLWGLMAVYLLNISIDPADPNPENIPEDLSFNDQESIIEVVVEKFLGFEDAIKEYDDNDSDDNQNKKQFKVDILTSNSGIDQSGLNDPSLKVQYYPNQEFRLVNGFFEVDSPPPKV